MSQTKAYQKHQTPAPGNPQANEAWALLEAARRMAAVVEFGDLNSPQDKRKMRDALRLNLRLWTIIQAEQAVGENPLPDPVRVNILTLCKYIDQQTADCMIEPTPEKVVSLIDINRNIAAGLLGSVSDEDLESGAAEPAAEKAQTATQAPQGEATQDAPEEDAQPRRQSLAVDI